MWSQLDTQKGILYDMKCPLLLNLKGKEQLEGFTAIWCKCSLFWGAAVWKVVAQSKITSKQLDPD
jgi:hypothetical protein